MPLNPNPKHVPVPSSHPPHANHLCEPTGFKHAWHQDDICCCVDLVGQSLTVHHTQPATQEDIQVQQRTVVELSLAPRI